MTSVCLGLSLGGRWSPLVMAATTEKYFIRADAHHRHADQPQPSSPVSQNSLSNPVPTPKRREARTVVACNSKASHGTFSRLDRKTLCPGATKLTSKNPMEPSARNHSHRMRGYTSALSRDLDPFVQEPQVLHEEAFMVSVRRRPARSREANGAGGTHVPSVPSWKPLSRAVLSHHPSGVRPRPQYRSGLLGEPPSRGLTSEAPQQPHRQAAETQTGPRPRFLSACWGPGSCANSAGITHLHGRPRAFTPQPQDGEAQGSRSAQGLRARKDLASYKPRPAALRPARRSPSPSA